MFHAQCAGVSESTLSKLLTDCGLCWLCKQCDALRKSKKPVLFPEIEATAVNSMDGILTSLGNAINSIRADLLLRFKQDLLSERALFDSTYMLRETHGSLSDHHCPLTYHLVTSLRHPDRQRLLHLQCSKERARGVHMILYLWLEGHSHCHGFLCRASTHLLRISMSSSWLLIDLRLLHLTLWCVVSLNLAPTSKRCHLYRLRSVNLPASA